MGAFATTSPARSTTVPVMVPVRGLRERSLRERRSDQEEHDP